MQKTQVSSPSNRAKTAGASFGLGGIVAGAAAAGGEPIVAAAAFLLIGGLGTVLAYSGAEWAVIQGEEADERQRSINDEAVRVAYLAVLFVALAGFVSELAHGDAGPFTLICFVGGLTNMLAVYVLKRRR